MEVYSARKYWRYIPNSICTLQYSHSTGGKFHANTDARDPPRSDSFLISTRAICYSIGTPPHPLSLFCFSFSYVPSPAPLSLRSPPPLNPEPYQLDLVQPTSWTQDPSQSLVLVGGLRHASILSLFSFFSLSLFSHLSILLSLDSIEPTVPSPLELFHLEPWLLDAAFLSFHPSTRS